MVFLIPDHQLYIDTCVKNYLDGQLSSNISVPSSADDKFACAPGTLLFDPAGQHNLCFVCVKCSQPLDVTQTFTNTPRGQRCVYHMQRNLVLVSRLYECVTCGIKYPAHDDSILGQIPDHITPPMILFHKMAVSRDLFNLITSMIVNGSAFSQVAATNASMTCTTLQEISQKCTISKDLLTSSDVFNGPSEDTIREIFLFYYRTFKPQMDQEFKKLTATSIKLDHTFKISKLVKVKEGNSHSRQQQFKAMLIILNEDNLIVRFAITRTESLKELTDVLTDIKEQCQSISTVYTDCCCKDRGILQEVLGDVRVCLDLFHAVQRVVRTVKKTDFKFHGQSQRTLFFRQLRLLFRAKSDQDHRRTEPTPTATEIEDNITTFLETWEDKISTETVQELMKLKTEHSSCLSSIPVRGGTSSNENLHKEINKMLRGKQQLSLEVAISLLHTLFYRRNMRKLKKPEYHWLQQPPLQGYQETTNQSVVGHGLTGREDIKTSLPPSVEFDYDLNKLLSNLQIILMCIEDVTMRTIEVTSTELFLFSPMTKLPSAGMPNGNEEQVATIGFLLQNLSREIMGCAQQDVQLVVLEQLKQDHNTKYVEFVTRNNLHENTSTTLALTIIQSQLKLHECTESNKLTEIASFFKFIVMVVSSTKPYYQTFIPADVECKTPCILAATNGHSYFGTKRYSSDLVADKNDSAGSNQKCECGRKSSKKTPRCTTDKCVCIRENKSCDKCGCQDCVNPVKTHKRPKLKKKKGCRCGETGASASSGVCNSQRCPCYREQFSCQTDPLCTCLQCSNTWGTQTTRQVSRGQKRKKKTVMVHSGKLKKLSSSGFYQNMGLAVRHPIWSIEEVVALFVAQRAVVDKKCGRQTMEIHQLYNTIQTELSNVKLKKKSLPQVSFKLNHFRKYANMHNKV